MTRVAVSGAGGRMGRLIAEAVTTADGFDLVALYDPSHGGDEAGGVAISADPAVVGDAEVVVEFTVPDAVMGNLEAWRSLGVHAVVGTSGFDSGRIAAVRQSWGTGPPNCLIVPNFSTGAVLMMRFAEIAAPFFPASEIVEMHHDGKVDAPSGTALSTAERMRSANPDQRREAESVESVPGARGGDAGPRIHSIRLPGVVARQEVVFGGPGETLTIGHDTIDRSAFVPGVLLAIRAVADLPDPVTVGLEGVLFEPPASGLQPPASPPPASSPQPPASPPPANPPPASSLQPPARE
jgi:4-hydroxy-tetrahydrodipicolinate reductase